ncbi:hypothetical protein M011DRAFT_401757 [Sporormia fimetaria CBS 119925]|uniref:Rab-GAP TBC domain-containing protein n=1 Tax=Sporormia fimetaria CBS 119925 TaxID=1340428 RepID=A0A6A6VD94_9PLEO|nr:hypothetical protein M011DRAFT_401757 [Sporormia fimetaria CBS 119925]
MNATTTGLDEKEALGETTRDKREKILLACRERDLDVLVTLAISENGLMEDTLRRTAWPILLGCETEEPHPSPSWHELPPHRDEEQVAKDVDRAFVYYPQDGDQKLARRKEELSNIIVEVLRRHPSLCYIQGFHDIVQVVYLVLGPQDSPSAITRLSFLRIRDYVLPEIDPAILHLELLPGIIKAADPELYDQIPKMQPSFALGATLTLFSHVIDAYPVITRLFDFFLASDAAIPIYVYASVLLSRREYFLALDKDEYDEAMFSAELGRFPQPFDVEEHIQQARKLYNQIPPESLGWAWRRVSRSSVLKTTRSAADVAHTPLDTGKRLFSAQEREVSINQARKRLVSSARRVRIGIWRRRRLCLSLVIGACALWLGKQHGGGAAGAIVMRLMRTLG